MAFITSLEGMVTWSLSVFATSSFYQHSLVSTVQVVQLVVYAVVKPPMAKIADVFGRLEAFAFSVLLYVLGLVQMAASNNVESYAAAQIFYAAGNTGLQILQQVFIADTSDLLNRAFWSSLPDVPFLVTVWIGSIIGQQIYQQSGWRWGYGMWTIVLPVAFLPLALSLFLNQRKAAKVGRLPPSPFKSMPKAAAVKKVIMELDIGGIILLSAAFALILIPLTIAAKQDGGWSNGGIIAMLVIGFLCLIALPFYESNKTLAPHPLIPLHLVKNGTFMAGCGIGFFYFSKSFLLPPFPNAPILSTMRF
jgi:MFS family permease